MSMSAATMRTSLLLLVLTTTLMAVEGVRIAPAAGGGLAAETVVVVPASRLALVLPFRTDLAQVRDGRARYRMQQEVVDITVYPLRERSDHDPADWQEQTLRHHQQAGWIPITGADSLSGLLELPQGGGWVPLRVTINDELQTGTMALAACAEHIVLLDEEGRTPAHARLDAGDLSTAEGDWKRIVDAASVEEAVSGYVLETRYARLRSNLNGRGLRLLGHYADDVIASLHDLFGVSPDEPYVKCNVVVEKRLADLERRLGMAMKNRSLNRVLGGFYLKHLRVTLITSERIRGVKLDAKSRLGHELSHQFLHLRTGNPAIPSWFDEGLAVHCEHLERGLHETEFGVPAFRLTALRRYYHAGHQPLAPIAQYLIGGGLSAMHYSEAYMFVHELLQRDEDFTQTRRLWRDLRAGEPARSALEEAYFHHLDPEELQAETIRKVRRRTVRPLRIPVGDR